ncbi:MAG: hypothetical protein ACREJM_02785, partial [Candidatus Saccharimonadales bacterium]
ANPVPFEDYLRQCDEKAEALLQKLEAAGMTGRVAKEELLARARAKGLLPHEAADVHGPRPYSQRL